MRRANQIKNGGSEPPDTLHRQKRIGFPPGLLTRHESVRVIASGCKKIGVPQLHTFKI